MPELRQRRTLAKSKAAATAGALQAGGLRHQRSVPNPGCRCGNAGAAPAAAANGANATAAAERRPHKRPQAANTPAATSRCTERACTLNPEPDSSGNSREYLQQLGLSPQAQNQMLHAARILNNLDPPAIQQAIVELRAQAASLAAQARERRFHRRRRSEPG